jgi:hypothetical protein
MGAALGVTAAQRPLFKLPPPTVDESKLGPNQRAVLERIDRFGDVGTREAGRIVYRRRGWNPDRIDKEWLARTGLSVLVSLRSRGLVFCRKADSRWLRRQAFAGDAR